MIDVMGVLFAAGNDSKLNELTIHRTTASMPFGGRYRLIDFTLSNLVNSGITTIGIITRSHYSSLMDHIRMGRDWDLNRKNSGIAVFPPYAYNINHDVFKSKIEAIHTILDYIEKAKEDYVIMSNCSIAGNIDFDAIYNEHIEQGADITILCKRLPSTTSRRIILEKDKDNNVTDMYVSESAGEEEHLIGLDIYLMKKDLLISLVSHAFAHGYNDFEKDILFKLIGAKKLKAKEITGYVSIIDDVKTYYYESMKLLDRNLRDELFSEQNKIYTKIKDSTPTKYLSNALVKNSLIADGCQIDGEVENSILFRNVTIEKGAKIKNSIIMEGGHIMQNSSVSYAITDKSVTIKENRSISGYQSYPVVLVKNKVV